MGVLQIQHMDKELGPQNNLILKDLNFEIDSGEFVALVGKSGSGKSTLLYILSTLDWPTRGQVRFFGQDTTKMDPKALHELRNHNIGFVFQFHYLLPELSALENVLMPARKAGILEKKKAFAEELLETVGLKDRMHHTPRELSGGQAQRVAIARALVMQPQFLFADEPTGSLDSSSSVMVFDIFKKINAEMKTTIVMVTHDRDLAAATGRQIHLVDGQIVKDARVSF